MLNQANERRNHARIATHLPARFGISAVSFSGTINSLSFGGALIQTPQVFEPGTQLKLQFKTPKDPDPIEASAHVVWTHDKDSMGVQFFNLGVKEINKLEKMLLAGPPVLGSADLWD